MLCRRFSSVFIPVLVWLSGCLAMGVRPCGAAGHDKDTSASTAAPPEARGFTPTTTHIEADPWRVFKVEKPEPMAPRNVDVSTSGDNRPATINLNWNGLIDLQKHVDPQGRDRSVSVGFFRVPFFRMFYINRDGVLIWEDKKVPRVMNWYLFALMDGVVEKDYRKKNALGGNSTYARVALFDAPLIFTGYKYKFEAPQSFYWEALDLPLSTTISHKTDKNKNEWRVLNLPLFCGWRFDQDGTVTTTNLLTSVVGVYFREQKPKDDDWMAGYAFLLGNLAHGRQNHAEAQLTLLEGNTVYDNSLFFLWRRTTENDINCTFQFHSQQYLKLPFLGPVYASWTSPKGSHRALFPKIFRWQQAPQSIQTIF